MTPPPQITYLIKINLYSLLKIREILKKKKNYLFSPFFFLCILIYFLTKLISYNLIIFKI
jgi:hypothetical protein